MGKASAEWREQKLNEQFSRWELRGRGWEVFDEPVALEPPFRVFDGHFLPTKSHIDDGRKHTLVSGFLSRFARGAVGPQREEEALDLEIEPKPEFRDLQEFKELQLSLSLSRSVPTLQVEEFLRHVCRASETFALEILSTERETIPQYVALPRAIMRVQRAAEACFPGLVVIPAEETLSEAWRASEARFAVAELGLGCEFMLPLGNPRADLLAAVVTAMDVLEKEELALFQVLVEPVCNPWSESVIRAVTNRDGGPFFANRPELVRAAQQKIAMPLFGVVIRLASSAADVQRAWQIIADIAAPLSALARPGSNYLVPLANDGYLAADHEQDILNRQSRRSGMVLNMEEVMSLLTPPTTSNSRKLRRETKRTNPAPEIVADSRGLFLGNNIHAGTNRKVFLATEHRIRHCHIIGTTGTGKSTLLQNLIAQDIARGQGVALFDPDGDLVNAVLATIPFERRKDVVLLDASDEEHSVGLNILAAHSDSERGLLASDLVSVFRRLSTSWGDQMETVLRNGILAFLESSRGGTLADLSRFLLDPGFRKEFLRTVTDPKVVYYWTKAFSGEKSIGPLLARLDDFLSRKPISHMVSQSENRVDFADILDSGKILLVKLPHGLIGEKNTALLGSFVTTKLQMAAMSRQRLPAAQRRDFWCYMDEFQHFITPSMTEIMVGARKYRLGMILAHHELRQLEADRDVASAVLAHCDIRIVFKVGDADARALHDGFSHFEARDLMNLGVGDAVCRVERSDFDFNITVPGNESPTEEEAIRVRDEVVAVSRAQYARPRSEIEAELLCQWQTEAPAKKASSSVTPSSDQDFASTAASEALNALKKPTIDAQMKTGSQVSVTSAESPTEVQAHPVQSHDVNEAHALAPESAAEHQHDQPSSPLAHFSSAGAQHAETKDRVKEIAEKLGFHARAEKTVLGGAGRVDVSLKADGLLVACEVSETRTVEGEVENVRKCLAAGYDAVITIARDKAKLVALAEAFAASFSGEEMRRIHVCQLRGIGALLKRMLRDKKMADGETARSGGYKIKRKYASDPTDEEAQKIEADIFESIARVLRGE
jgi:hypothetical protein